MNNTRNLLLLLDHLVIGASILLAVFSYVLHNIDLALFSVIIFWGGNIIYGMRKFTERALFVFFNLFIFLFLLSRPTIAYAYDIIWWEIDYDATFIALFILLLSLFGIRIGDSLSVTKKIELRNFKDRFSYDNYLLLILFFSFSFLKLYVEYEKYLKYSGLSYTELYIPKDDIGLIEILSSFYIYFFIIFLATFPRLKWVFFTFFVYILSMIPSLLLGERVNIAVAMVFLFLYFLLSFRVIKNNYFTLSLNKIIFVIIIASLSMILFSKVQDYREKGSSNYYGMNTLANFMYLQGTSFDTLIQGIYFEKEIKEQNSEYVSYTLGPAIDQLRFNKVTQVLFNTEGLESGNSLSTVRKSNNLAHPLSYIVLDGSYLNGHGRGSSYILEAYLDFKYVGVIILSILLGNILNKVWNSIYSSNYLYRCVVLLIIMNIVLLPRINYIFFFLFVFDIKFWICTLVGYFSLKLRN